MICVSVCGGAPARSSQVPANGSATGLDVIATVPVPSPPFLHSMMNWPIASAPMGSAALTALRTCSAVLIAVPPPLVSSWMVQTLLKRFAVQVSGRLAPLLTMLTVTPLSLQYHSSEALPVPMRVAGPDAGQVIVRPAKLVLRSSGAPTGRFAPSPATCASKSNISVPPVSIAPVSTLLYSWESAENAPGVPAVTWPSAKV